MAFATLTEGLEAVQGSTNDVRFIDANDGFGSIAFEELSRRALGLLSHLRERGLGAGSQLVICTNNNAAFVDAFWACQLGGIVAVPIAPGMTEEHRHKLFRVYSQLQDPFVYTDLNNGGKLRALADKLGIDAEYQRLKSRTILIENIADLSHPATPAIQREDDVSFIQFSSGSTSDPKGVILTHRNLSINIQDIHKAAQVCSDDISLSWMPLTHDMGLIGFHLAMLLRGVTHYIMATDVFVRRPLLWLETASAEKVSLLCSPNFGYRLFLKAFERWRIADLDLSHVRVIFNGAEPVSPQVCDRFLSTLDPFGLKRSAMVPVYGLAEATVGVSISPLESPYQTVTLRRASIALGDRIVEDGGDQAIRLVAVGHCLEHCMVRITDGAGAALPAEHVGHVEIKGPNVTAGYYALPVPDRSAYTDDEWFGTGDVGFVKNELLYITGRLKDVMFVNGQNYYAHDLEDIACEIPQLEPGRVVMCAAPNADGSAELVVAFVLHFGDEQDLNKLASALRGIVAKRAGVEIAAVVPVDQIPRTTSGKIQRYALQQAYANGEFDEVLKMPEGGQTPHATGSYSAMEDLLLEICVVALDGHELGRDDNFFEIGLNSLKLVEIHELIDQRLPSQLEISDIFEHPTLAGLAAFLESKQ